MNTSSKQTYALTLVQRRRICWRMARGWSLEKAAAAEGIALPDAEQLLEDGDFVGLIDAYKQLADRPEEERHRRLVEMAWLVLETAMFELGFLSSRRSAAAGSRQR